MSYTPTTWAAGDTVTVAKLNKLEQGVAAGGVLVVHYENGAFDKTWQEIHDAVASGQFIVIQNENDDGIFWNYISSVESSGGDYYVYVFWSGSKTTSELYTDSPNGYPAG